MALGAAGRAGISEVTTQDVASFLAALREGDPGHPPLAASSAGRAVVAVRGLHAFALAEGLAAADPARQVRPPAPPILVAPSRCTLDRWLSSIAPQAEMVTMNSRPATWLVSK